MQPQFDFNVVTCLDVLQSLAAIKSNAVGEDGIPLRFIKMILPYIITHITDIINSCIMTSTFPQSWKIAKVIPIAKKNNPNSANDYRPISILPCLSKVFEKLLAGQMKAYLEEKCLLNPCQSGFRSGHSCSTAMVNILEEIRQPFDRGFLTLLCLLDFSKAFDKVNHQILCWKLRKYFHFGSCAVKLVSSFLSNRFQRVVAGDKFSALKPLTQGVPQGSILGPILFCMFINDLPSVCRHVSIHLYADDVQLHLSRPCSLINELVLNLNKDLLAIYEWSVKNGLLLNPSKSQVIPISNAPIIDSVIPDVSLSASKLQLVKSATSLGFIINRNLSCYNHVNYVVGRIYGCLRKLWLTADFTPVETRKRLVIALIVPLITYAEVVYSSLDSLSQRKLQVAFNDAVRYIYGLRRSDHISAYSRSVLGCSLTEYLSARNCIFLHTILKNKAPTYLFNKFIFARSQRSQHLLLPRFQYLNSSRLFFIHAVRLWNSLPVHIKRILNPDNFKKKILHYFSMQQ